MTNNLIALIIIACGIIGGWGSIGKKGLFALLGVVLSLLLVVAINSARVSDFGPAAGLAGFLLPLIVLFVVRRKR